MPKGPGTNEHAGGELLAFGEEAPEEPGAVMLREFDLAGRVVKQDDKRRDSAEGVKALKFAGCGFHLRRF